MPLYYLVDGDSVWREFPQRNLNYATFGAIVSAGTTNRLGSVSRQNLTLPEGVDWVGTYYPCVAVGPNIYGDFVYSSITNPPIAYTNPIAARGQAEAFLAADPMPNARASFVQCGDVDNYPRLPVPFYEQASAPASLNGTTHTPITVGTCCSKCGFPGHNSRTCTASEDVDRVGIEIEGRWIDVRAAQRKGDVMGANNCGDGSVNGKPGFTPREFQTKPGNVGIALKQLAELYPDDTGPDCGMHVHVSFKCETYFTLLSNTKFFEYFRNRWSAWGAANGLHPESEFFKRLRGENQYCHPNTDGDRVYSQDRYLQLNFSAWGEHRTVECRLLPMFKNASLGAAAVIELVQIFKDWISRDSLLALATDMPAEEFNDSQALVGFREPVRLVHTLDALDLAIPPPNHQTESISISELAPVAPGMRRVALSAPRMAALRDLDLLLAA